MQKFSCIFSFLFIFSFASIAQEQYIEVIVKDTLYVEPQRWILFVNIEKQYDYMTTTTDTVAAPAIDGVAKMPKPKEGTPPDEIKGLVKKFKGTVMTDTENISYMAFGRSRYNSE